MSQKTKFDVSVLAAEGISQRYDGFAALMDVSVSIYPGSVTVLMGRSGSGKSTLIRAMSLVEPITAGKITLDGIPVSHPQSSTLLGQSALWPAITVVFQQLFLWPHLTLEENILLPAKLRNRSVSEFPELCRSLDIGEIVNRFPNQVSVGQRQRAAIARALLLQPKYLLLDEVTSAQDVEQVVNLLGLLIEVVVRGIGLLVVTHHVGFAKQLLNKSKTGQIIFIDRGRVIETGDQQSFEKPSSVKFQKFLSAIEAVR